MYSISFDRIYDYFYPHLTDEDRQKVSTEKCEEYMRPAFPDYQTYVDSNAIIDYDTKMIFTQKPMREIEKTLLGLLMFKKFIELQNLKYSRLTNLVTDSHKITGLGEVKRAVKEILQDTESKINEVLQTLS